ncbi:zinc finger protein var3 chloroplastic [Phtheirospermum japonicum]|uniref:Zinc finger protein var3 chloroplastic n=1 Tax=Phtheirospermum japonicum TaxID=374723 RepID=A0A830CA27_9LAMI|nr:zinc finger protein var3 chloroplastic [Phtheirospermum japonicum]
MGGATRFMTLLTTPIPPLRPSFLLRRRLSSISVAPRRLLTLSSPSQTKTKTPILQVINCFHSQSTNTTHAVQSSAAQHQQNHPWPEWTNFLHFLSNDQGLSAPEDHRIPPEDAFVLYEELSDDFVRAAAACIAFARARPNLLGLLSRRDIEAVVSNGTPFLFKSALDTARRMRAFLGTDGNYVSELDKANTIDLMKYILSYVSNPTVSSERKGLYSRELVDSSVRNLLHEMGTVTSGAPTGYNMPVSRQSPKPFGQNIEMKRGDWICQKCDFMNFAKNVKCLECEEPRPKRQLIGGEWECPQCNFFNYGRNLVCLRCDCRRPGAPLFNNNSSQLNSGYNEDKTHTSKRLGENEEKAQRWFSKISQLNRADDSNNSAAFNEKFPEITPLRKTENTLVNSQKKEQAEISGVKNENFQIDNHAQEKDQAQKSERWFKKMAELHDVKDLPSAVSDEDFPEIMPMRTGENRFVVSKKKDRLLTSPKYKRQVATDQANTTKFVPFVPFPPGYFSKNDDTDQFNGKDSPVKADQKPMNSEDSNYTSEVPRLHNQPTGSTLQYPGNNNVGPTESKSVRSNWTGKSLEASAVKEPDPLDMSEEAKAERWFKRVAQIKDISELSQIPDEDFPSIMPMRKGVNRFVVSKRKTPLERRLTSHQYRRNLPTVSSESVKKENDSSS